MPRQLLILAASALLVITCVARAWADPLADEMTTMNARWDAAINNADFDALLPMYTADARLMPPVPSLSPARRQSVGSLLGGEKA
jgi:ketosteroid isomerase-like protein